MLKPTYSIVVCVHNALDDVRRCLQSLLLCDLRHSEIVIVDDGSQSETQEFLTDFAANQQNVTLVRHDAAKGYTKAANAGARASRGDFIVMLNSDTIVPTSFLVKLRSALDDVPDAGIVGPLSNAATWQSVPDVVASDGKFAVNDLPDGLTVDDMDALVASVFVAPRPRVPLVNGFCLMIRREVFNALGEFDEVNFPKGYGEENDFCFRATDAGFGIVVATDTYVFHAKSKSYGPVARSKLSEEGSRALALKYSERRLSDASKTFRTNPLMLQVRENVRAKLDIR